MNAIHAIVEQVMALLGGVVNPDALYSLLIISGAGDSPKQLCRVSSASREISHALHSRSRGDGHDSRNDRHVYTNEATAGTKIVKVMIVEKQLRADVVGTGIYLCLQVLHLR